MVVSFVKGHADAVDVATGRATVREAQWNNFADKLAVEGAAPHAVPEPVKARFRRQAEVTKLMQRTLLDIHAAALGFGSSSNWNRALTKPSLRMSVRRMRRQLLPCMGGQAKSTLRLFSGALKLRCPSIAGSSQLNLPAIV